MSYRLTTSPLNVVDELLIFGRCANPVINEVMRLVVSRPMPFSVVGSYGSGKTTLVYAIMLYGAKTYAGSSSLLPLYINVNELFMRSYRKYRPPIGLIPKISVMAMRDDIPQDMRGYYRSLAQFLENLREVKLDESLVHAERIEALIDVAYSYASKHGFSDVLVLLDELERPYLTCLGSREACSRSYGLVDEKEYIGTLFEVFNRLFEGVTRYVTLVTPGLYGKLDRQLRERLGAAIRLDEKYTAETISKFIDNICEFYPQCCEGLDDQVKNLLTEFVKSPRVLVQMMASGITIDKLYSMLFCMARKLVAGRTVREELRHWYRHVKDVSIQRTAILLIAAYLENRFGVPSVTLRTIRQLVALICRRRDEFHDSGLIDHYLHRWCEDPNLAAEKYEDWLESSLAALRGVVRKAAGAVILEPLLRPEAVHQLAEALDECIG